MFGDDGGGFFWYGGCGYGGSALIVGSGFFLPFFSIVCIRFSAVVCVPRAFGGGSDSGVRGRRVAAAASRVLASASDVRKW